MPYQRIENKFLEYEYSTMHQIFCYDIQKNNLIVMNLSYLFYNSYSLSFFSTFSKTVNKCLFILFQLIYN